MKKTCNYLLFLLFMFIFYIGVTNAESCVVESGTGKNIGDEIVCGTEHFYVISNDGENIKMLGKYNLLAGSTYEKITFDEFVVSNKADRYKQKDVQEKLIAGYDIDYFIYNTNENGTYTYTGAVFNNDFYTDYTAVFFDATTKVSSEVYNIPEVKAILDKGYSVQGFIADADGYYYGVKFYKTKGYNFKTLTFETKAMSKHEFYQREDVLKLLNEGYAISRELYGSYTCPTSGTKECIYNYNGAVFYKKDGFEYKNFIFDEVVEYSNYDAYIESHEEIQSLIADGYKIDERYLSYFYISSTTSQGKTVGVMLSKGEEAKEYVYQDETAIGAHGDEIGNPAPREVGIFVSEENWGYDDYAGETYLTGFRDFEYSSYSDVYDYLNLYSETLKDKGFNVSNVNTLTVSDINYIVKTVTGEEIPLEDWYNDTWEEKTNSFSGDEFYVLGSIKELMPEGYEWLWGTTYWTRTSDADGYNMYFVDTLGDLCSSYFCYYSVGAGIRPLVTISANDVIYKIETKTDGNGTIVPSTETEYSGKEVTFVVTPNEGYVLSLVKVTDSSGNTVTFTDYKFTMPDKNVLIEATFVPDNPDTGDAITIISFVVLLVLALIKLRSWKKMKFLE